MTTKACGRTDARPAHINNLYNTVFWALIQQGGKSEREAYEILRVRLAAICDHALITHRVLYRRTNTRSFSPSLVSITTSYPRSIGKVQRSCGHRTKLLRRTELNPRRSSARCTWTLSVKAFGNRPALVTDWKIHLYRLMATYGSRQND